MKLGVGLVLLFACVLVAAAEDKPETSAVKKCEPGTEVKKDCGVCTCNAEGTEYTCNQKCQQENKTPGTAPVAEERCTPGQLFKKGCNECKCPDSGVKAQAACTIIACPEE